MPPTRKAEEPSTLKDLCAIVMAAGQGTRMRSNLVKILHPLNGLPMVRHVLELCRRLGVKRTLVVIGYQAERVRDVLGDLAVEFVMQADQRGTAHAVLQAEAALQGFDGDLFVINGDVPLLGDALVERLVAMHRSVRAHATLVTTRLANPQGYGRVLRDRRGAFRAIVEEAEATPAERRITEINAGRFSLSTNVYDLVGRHNMAVTYVRLALGDQVAIREQYDVAEDYYMVRDLDTLPGIFHAEAFLGGMIDARPAQRVTGSHRTSHNGRIRHGRIHRG